MNNGIKLFVGLGNPGEKYEKTRHNAGFWWIDLVAQQTKSSMHLDAKMFGLVGKLNPHAEQWLLKPTTFMNASGKAVAAIANYYKIKPEEILVIHDELDIPTGQGKFKFGGGHGGHNGLRDIHAALGTADYWRLRIGIGHPRNLATGDKTEVINYVLKPPSKDEQNAIDDIIFESSKCLDAIIKGDFETAMLTLHTKK